VITYDLRGHGASTLPEPTAGTVHDDIADLVALLNWLGLGPVAGNSSGACIAMRLATEHPALVSSTLAHEPYFDSLLAGDPTLHALHQSYVDALDAMRGCSRRETTGLPPSGSWKPLRSAVAPRADTT
jgi:pimeloyl-ACP methyl ester carboxylesterase